jgi:ATP-dependent RNA helicase DDX47/RRP3
MDREPKELLEEKDEQSSVTTFNELGINEELCSACQRIGWNKPMPIQEKVIPVALAGKDVIGLAETG